MKRVILFLMAVLLFVGVNVFAAGDLVVNGQFGVGKSPVNAKIDVNSTTETFGLSLLHTRDNTGPIWGSSYFVFMDGTTGIYDSEAGGFINSVVYRRQTDSSADSLLYAGSNQAYIGITNGSGYTINNLASMLISNGMHANFNADATLANGYGLLSKGLHKNGSGTLTVSDFRHIYLENRGDQYGNSSLSVTRQTGLWIDKQELGTSNYGVVLNGDGAGADIVFGASQGSRIYSSAGRLYAEDSVGNQTIISPHDPETGEWIYYSRNIKTGVVKKVNMEKLIKAVEELTGERFIIETMIEAE